jgi:peptidyl-prolyl cis-trans isomerase D
VPFEQAKPDLEKQLKHDAAQKKVYDQVEAYEKAHEGGANMAESAKAVGASVAASGEIAQNGATPKGQPPAGVSPKMLTKAFGMAQGEESDTEDEGNGEYYVVRVDKITPSALPKLADVREQATKGYMQRKLIDALKAKAEELSARVRKGESLEAVAASIGAKVEHTASLDKAQAQQQAQALGMQVLQAVFGAAKGDVVVAPRSAESLSVVKIDDVQTGPIDQLAPLADVSRRQANGALINDMVQAAQVQAASALKPKIDAARAAQTLGITADQVDSEAKAAKPAKKAKG